jgi:hypothetical protein
MVDPRTDQIAREAARIIGKGRTDDIPTAIRLATSALGLQGVPIPGAGRVRKHAQAMTMQALGEAAYAQARTNLWRIAEQVMAVFEHAMPDAASLLVGRAAQGFFDAGVTVHIRLYTRIDVGAIASALVEYGYDEPEFSTVETRKGRLSQVRFKDESLDIVVTRCMPELKGEASLDLVTGKTIEVIGLEALRRRLDEIEMRRD